MATTLSAVTKPLVAAPTSFLADRAFRFVTFLAAATIGLLFLLVVVVLYRGAHLSISQFGWRFLIGTNWDPVSGQFGALPFIYGTVVSSIIALLIAVPLSVERQFKLDLGAN